MNHDYIDPESIEISDGKTAERIVHAIIWGEKLPESKTLLEELEATREDYARGK